MSISSLFKKIFKSGDAPAPAVPPSPAPAGVPNADGAKPPSVPKPPANGAIGGIVKGGTENIVRLELPQKAVPASAGRAVEVKLSQKPEAPPVTVSVPALPTKKPFQIAVVAGAKDPDAGPEAEYQSPIRVFEPAGLNPEPEPLPPAAAEIEPVGLSGQEAPAASPPTEAPAAGEAADQAPGSSPTEGAMISAKPDKETADNPDNPKNKDEEAISFVLDMSGKIDAGGIITPQEKEKLGSYIEFLNSQGYDHTLGVIYEVLSKNEGLMIGKAPSLDPEKEKILSETVFSGNGAQEKLEAVIGLIRDGRITPDDLSAFYALKLHVEDHDSGISEGVRKKLESILKNDSVQKESRRNLEDMIKVLSETERE
jgi:hypothetical protein